MQLKLLKIMVVGYILIACTAQSSTLTTQPPIGVEPSPIETDLLLATITPNPTGDLASCEVQPLHLVLSDLLPISTINLPPPRINAAMVYDKNRNIVILFGGGDDAGFLNDTWEYNGLEWMKVNTRVFPSGRSWAAMEYDSNRKIVVMFGGSGKDPIFDDLWEYDGTDWQELQFNDGPTELRFPTFSYYPPWEKIILFGEYQDTATYQTWVYNGSSWQNLNQDLPAIPMPSTLYQTVYDSCRQKLYLQMLGNWTYEFDGRIWQVIANEYRPYLPIPLSNTVYDSRRGIIVLYGTLFGGDWKSQTWEFDGMEWKQVQPLESPPPRTGHAMVFDEGRGVTVLFGGVTEDGIYLNDTWEYDGITWVQR